MILKYKEYFDDLINEDSLAVFDNKTSIYNS